MHVDARESLTVYFDKVTKYIWYMMRNLIIITLVSRSQGVPLHNVALLVAVILRGAISADDGQVQIVLRKLRKLREFMSRGIK